MSTFTDVVRGEVSVEWSTISDFVIVRSDGSPLFFLANAVDDLAMGITHVIRGEDLIDTTHRVLAIRARARRPAPSGVRAPPADPPGRSRQALEASRLRSRSRTSAPAAILAEALVNYLALLGWAPDDEREVLTRDEIVAAFTSSGSRLGRDLRREEARVAERRVDPPLPLDELVARLSPFADARAGRPRRRRRRAAARGGRGRQERASTLVALVEQMEFLFVAGDDFVDRRRRLGRASRDVERGAEVLDAVIAHVETCEWTVEALRPVAARSTRSGSSRARS